MDLAKPENINITHKSHGEGIGSRWGTQAPLGKLLNHSEGEVQRTWRAACTLQPIYTFYTESHKGQFILAMPMAVQAEEFLRSKGSAS